MLDFTKVNGRHYINGYCVIMSREAAPNKRISSSGYLLVTNDEYCSIVRDDLKVIERIADEAETSEIERLG